MAAFALASKHQSGRALEVFGCIVTMAATNYQKDNAKRIANQDTIQTNSIPHSVDVVDTK